MATEANIPQDESASKTILEQGYSMTGNKSSMELSISEKSSPTEYICKSEHCQADKLENITFTKLSEDERQHQTAVVSNDVEAGGCKVEAINETDIEESTHHTEKDGENVSRQACAEEPMTDQHKSSEVIAESTQKGMITSQENENTRSKLEEGAVLECIKQPANTSETNMGLISEAPLPKLDLTTKNQGEEDERVAKSCAKDEIRDPTMHVEDQVKELSLEGVQKKTEDTPSLQGDECKDPESIGSSDKSEHDNNTEDASATLKLGDNVDDKLENPYSDQVTEGVRTQVATEARETLQEVASTVCRDEIKDISEDSRINLEKHHEDKRDSQPENGLEDQQGEQVTLIPGETEIVASRENAEKRVEQNILPVEEFEERGEKDEPISTPDGGETSISSEKIPPLAESITKIEGEENMIPQRIVNDLNSTDPFVGETGKPDSTEVPKTEAREEHQESSKFCSENNEQDEQLSETQSTENLVVKHMDSEAMDTTETVTELTKDTEELPKVPYSHTEGEIGINGDEKIISDETTEGEEAINMQLFATESAIEDEDPSNLSTVASARDEMIEQSSHEESTKDGEITMTEKHESHRTEDEADESKRAAQVFDLPNTRGVQDTEETLDNFQENETQIPDLRDGPHEEIKGENHVSDRPPEFIQNTGLEDGYSTSTHLYSSQNECYSAESKSSADSSSLDKSTTENKSKSEQRQADKVENLTFTKLSEDERKHQTGVVSDDVEAGGDKVEAVHEKDIEESNHHTEKDGENVSRQACAEEQMKDQHKSAKVIAESTQRGMITSQESENTRSKVEEDDVLECIKQPANTSETNMGLINEAPLPNLDLTTKNQGEEDERVEKSCAKDEARDPTIHVEDEVKELRLDGVQEKEEDTQSLLGAECKDPESIGSSNKLEHDNNKEDASAMNVEESRFDAAVKIGYNVYDKLENPYSDQVTEGVSAQVATESSETLQEVASTVCRDKMEEISQDSRINLEKNHEEKRDSQPETGQDSRENAEKTVEQNILPVEEFEERGEKDEPTSTPDGGETSISSEKIPPLAESITKIEGEENMIPQRIANDLNFTDPFVGETGQPDSTGEVPKTEAREEHQESSKFCSENNEQEEHISETQSTENLVVKHMDPEAMVTTETITKLTKDTEELQKVLDSHSEDEIDIKGDEKIISEETAEGEEAINKQLFATESATEDEDPSRLPTVASVRDETIEQSSHEESLNDGEIKLIEKNETHRPKDEAEESEKAAEVFDLPNTRGGPDIHEQQIIEGSVEETLDNFQENETQIQNLRDEPHEEIKGENHVSDHPQQNTGPEEGYSTATHLYSSQNECSSAESKSSPDSSSLDKSPTENICDSEHQILTKSENERHHQNGVEATKDKIIEENHHDIEDDGAKISKLASIEEPNPKVHEEKTSIDNKHLDQHLELTTDRHATSEVIVASSEKEMITSQPNESPASKRDKDADLECNRQASSILEKSCINNEDIDTTVHVEDEFKEIISTGLQNEKAGQVREVVWKDPESIRSSDKSEHENNEEFKLTTSSIEYASTVTVAPSPYFHAASSNNEDNDKEKLENSSSNLVADGENTQVAIEAAETMQDASNATSQDNNQDICESVRHEMDVSPVDVTAKAEDLAGLNRDIRVEHEENIIQTGLPDNNEESKVIPETHDGEKRNLNHENEQEHKVGEQAHMVLENTEIEASRENDEKGMEQNICSAQSFDVEEPTSAPNTREKPISTEKSLPLVESISDSEINNDERISPQQIANDLNTNHSLVEETGQPNSGHIVSKNDAPEEHQESSEFCFEYNKQHDHHPETQSNENLIIKQVGSIVTTETVSESIKDIEEIKKFPLSYSEEKIDIREDEKIIPEESKEMDETTDEQSHETAKESISEDQAPSRLLTTTLIGDETIEQSNMEESPKDSESSLTEKNENHSAENDAEEKIKAVQASEPSKATSREDIDKQQIMEGSVEGTMDKFRDNEKETEDASTEIKGENYDTGLPSKFNQNIELEERHSMTARLESNPNKCSSAEFESFVESSSPEKSQTEKIFESEQSQVDNAEAINDISIEEPDHDIKRDSAESSGPARAQKPNLKVLEEETSTDNSNLDQHLVVLTDQHASFEVIPESVEKEMITSQTNENTESRREEDADLECNDHVTSTSEITLGEISEASLPNLELATKSKSEEDESEIESLTKDEGIETTKHVEDGSKDLRLTGIQNRKAEMAFVPEGEQKDPESLGSSNKSEPENNREEDASTTNTVQIPYVYSVEESIFEAASENRDNEEDNRENPSSNPVTDEASQQVAIEVVETACKDKNKDTCESVRPEEDVSIVERMVKAEDSAYLDRDEKGANEEDMNQAGHTETIEDSRIDPETHDVEKRDSLQKNDPEYELGEQAVLIPEKMEEEAPREEAEKRIKQNTPSAEKIEEQEKDEPTSTPDSGETLISTEKSLPLAESTKKIHSEETIFPQNIESDPNTKDPLVEDSGNFDIDETGKETQTEAQEKFEDSNKTCTEIDRQDEQHSEAQSRENLVIKHVWSEEMATANTIIKSTKETEELDRVPESLSQEKTDIKGDAKIIPQESTEMEETTGVSENEALSRLPRTASVGEEKIEHSFQEESPKDGAAMIDKNESCIPENDAEKDEKAAQAFDLPDTNGREDINEKQVIEESVEETMKSFQDDKGKIQILREDTRREIEEKSSVSNLPSELTQHGKTDETILCESNVIVDIPEILGMSSKKEEQILFGEYGNPTPKEALIENQDECAYSMKVDEDKAQLSSQNFESLTYPEGEETCSQLEKFSQNEKTEEEPKDMDGEKENKASHQEVSEPSYKEVSALKPEEGEIESTAGALSSATVGMDTRKEYTEEVECDQTKIKQEVEVKESEEQIEATSSIERKISSPLDYFSKPKEDHDVLTIEENNTLVKGPSSTLGVPKNDSRSTNDSEAEFLRPMNENTAMKEVKPVDVDHLEGSDGAHGTMDVTTSETKSNCLGGVIAERQETETNSENRNMEVKEVVDQVEQISHDIKERDLITGINHEIELTTTDNKLVHAITYYSTVPSYGEPKTMEMSKTTDNTPAREDVLFVETATPSITHTERDLMLASLDNEKKNEYSNEGVQKQKDEAQPMLPNLKAENIPSESYTGDIVREKREQADGLANLNEARKLEIVEDEKSTIDVTKTLLQEGELTKTTEDSSAVTKVERKAAELKTATSGSQEEHLTTKSGELLMEKVEVSASKLTEQTESTKSTEGEKPLTEQNMEITDLNTLKSLDASETNTDNSSSTPKVYERETEASFIKKDDSATDYPKIVPVIVEIEETGLKDSGTGHIEYDRGSVIVSENEGETAITTDKTTPDSIDIVGREGNLNSEKEEILEELNEGNLKVDSSITEADKTTTVQQEREQSISTTSMSQDYPAPLVEEKATMGNAKIHPTDAKSTREEIIDEAAETHLVHSIENALPEKEHEVVKPGGTSDLESVNIKKECSNGDSPQLKNEVNEEKVLVEDSKCTTNSTREDSETVQGQDDKDTTLEGSLTNVAMEKAETALENEPTDELPQEKTVEAADTNEKVELAFESTTEDLRDEKIYQAEEKSNEDNVFESRESVPNEKFQGGIQREVDMQVEIEHHMNVPRHTDATKLGGCPENVPAATEMANRSQNILEHSPDPTSNLKAIVNEATATNSGFTEQGGGMDLVEERESRISENLIKANEDLSFTTIEESEEGLHRECEKENKAEISNKEDDTRTSETLPCMPETERNDVTTIDKGAKTSFDTIDTDNIQEERSSSEDGLEMGQETKDKAPSMENAINNSSITGQTVSNENQHEEKSEATEDDKDGKNVKKVVTELTHENRATRTEVMAQGEKEQEVEADGSQKEHTDTAEEIEKLEESSLGEVDIKATVKANAETRETNEDIEQGFHKPDEETKPEEVQLEKAKSTNITVESTQAEEENVPSSTREIQKLEESSLGEAAIKATVKADAEIREINKDIEQGLRKPDGETKAEVQLEKAISTNITVESTRLEEENVSSSTEEHLQAAKHSDEATNLAAKAQKAETPQSEEAKAESEEDEGVNENKTMELLPSGAAVMVKPPKDEEAKAKHKKSHNILSGVGSKVKHSISKVKKAITGKSSHPKTSSSK